MQDGEPRIGLILVTRMGQTPRSLIERAQDMLAEMNLPVLGCVSWSGQAEPQPCGS